MVRHRARRLYCAHRKMKAAKHKPVVLELQPQTARGGSGQTFGAGARGEAEVNEHKVSP
jgi:hypothetical protein